MPQRNTLPLQVMWQEGTTGEMLEGVITGIKNILLSAEVSKAVIVWPVGQRRQPLYWKTLNGNLSEHYSLDWYILQARDSSTITGHLNSAAFLSALASNPSHTWWPKYELVVIHEPLHWHENSPRIVGGIGRAYQGAIITLSDQLYLLDPAPGETEKSESAEAKQNRKFDFRLTTHMTTMHELAHVFGLFPGTGKADPTNNELKVSHCQNDCVMWWQINLALYKKIMNKPFCDSCLAKLKQFFIVP